MKEYNEQVVETLDDAGCIIANKNIIIDNLQARIAELEEENARLKVECDDIKQVQFPRKLEAVAVGWKKQLAAAQEENAMLKTESRDACFGLNDYYGRKLAAAQEECEFQRNAHKQAEELMLEQSKQLAAEQLNNKLLREALEAVIKVHGYESGIPVEALAQPSDTSALDAYVAEKVKGAMK